MPLSCEVVEKGGFGLPIVGEEMPRISDIRLLNCTSERVAGFG